MDGKKNRLGLVVLILSAMFLSACDSNRVAFTKDLIRGYALTEKDLAELQYYVSNEALFRHAKSYKEDYDIEEGVLVSKKSFEVDEVLVEEDTPGVAVGVGPMGKSLDISFEKRSSFPFKIGVAGVYEIQKKTRGKRTLFLYDGAPYFLVNQYDDIHLEVETEDLDKIKQNRKKLHGRELDD